jgi:hypothetical protein
MITGTYNSGSGLTTLYQDGAPVASASATNSGRSSTEGVVIGYSNAGYFNGRLDQVEISNLDRSANWIAAEYNNQHSPSTFYTIGPITLPQAGTGVVTAVIIM